MRLTFPALLVLCLALGVGAGAHAQSSAEDRLREAVKKLSADLRAAQYALAPMQQKLDEATRQRDALQPQLDAAKVDLAQQTDAARAAEAKLQQLQADVDAARKENTALQAALAKWQAAYKEAAGVAQAKDAEARRLDASLRTTRDTLEITKQTNRKLVAAARDILHLYQTKSFRELLLQSYEPLLGMKRTELENMVQDYEDRIEEGRLPVEPQATTTPAQK